jgi:hypothetical protein
MKSQDGVGETSLGTLTPERNLGRRLVRGSLPQPFAGAASRRAPRLGRAALEAGWVRSHETVRL